MWGRRTYDGRVAAVTGAAGGLGRALCQRLARAGAQLALLDLDGEGVAALADDLTAGGARAFPVTCDITDEAAVREAFARIERELGPLDLLVNNAGIALRASFADTDPAVYRKVMDVNFFGSLHCTKAALPGLRRRRGQIVVISSVAGLAPTLGRTGYAASKYALRGLFDTLRAELRRDGVGVLMVYPVFIDTGLGSKALDGDGSYTEHPQSRVGRQLTSEDAAGAIVDAAARNRRELVLGRVGHITRMINAHFPALYEALMARALRSELDR